MSASELFGVIGGIVSPVLAILLGLIAWTFTTFRSETNRAIEQLRAENRDQALTLATLKAGAHDERMLSILESLRDGFNRFSVIMDRFDRKLGGTSGGEYRAVTPPRGDPRSG